MKPVKHAVMLSQMDSLGDTFFIRRITFNFQEYLKRVKIKK